MENRNGIIVSYFGNSVAVEGDDGQVFQCPLKRNQTLPVVGDKVIWQLGNKDQGIIISILPRQSELSRGERNKKKPIAANIDAMFVVMSPPPVFSDYLVDRYLVAAEILKIPPIIVLNKMDLLSKEGVEAILAHLKIYQKIPYEVLLTSALTKAGLTKVENFLRDKTAVLVGPSGVGKSSLITALNADDSIRVADVSAKGIGKHTTTASKLYHLPNGGHLIDSPGVREFNLWSVSKKELIDGFPEFLPFLNACKFRDCIHLAEPGCAVKEAVASGNIASSRYADYQAFSQEMEKNKKC